MHILQEEQLKIFKSNSNLLFYSNASEIKQHINAHYKIYVIVSIFKGLDT